ncbi:conserved hypothetical protein [Paraburkholderia ribeironis]|uniref:Uncharacterized protein n=1 Tax=Paraburkholderia ribeironis TaxID=1247936 RepID=A0A1N7S8E0_9BURK|nr:hypothetical protein [Paraburkholderia ribeironis]SIT43601.1 conserved hypothetical protein [Paraburkholderia ribeironis]
MDPRLVMNRVVAIVVPKAPFVDWINGVDSAPGMALTLEQVGEDTNAFLVPASDAYPEVTAGHWLQKHWQTIFERMLADWCVDEHLWPRSRTPKMFKAWCEIRMHSIVLDCADEPIDYVA